MRIEPETVELAFRKHQSIYAAARAWSIPYHIRCWMWAREAFEQNAVPRFGLVFEELRKHWKVFRGANRTHWDAAQTYEVLQGLNQAVGAKRLDTLADEDLPALWQSVQAMAGIKTTKHGPSVVAISKFLHFWNPRLFVIVDHEVIWRWVLSHSWLKEQLRASKGAVKRALPELGLRDNLSYDLPTYLTVLLWAAELIRENPEITPSFAEYVRVHAEGEPTPPDLERYHAPAVEWLLLGLVELPPAGVVI